MQLKFEQLGKHIAGGLQPVYFVAGDEILLIEEACRDILEAAESAGFGERSRHDIGTGTDWDEIFDSASNMSLFAERKVIDIRLGNKGLDRAGSDAVRGYLEDPIPDTLVLLRAGSIEWRQRSSAWFKALEKQAVVLMVWPIRTRDLPRWLDKRCKAVGLNLNGDALAVLADRVEGNLLAAQQEIEKLRLLFPGAGVEVTEQDLTLNDASHFESFDLIDTAFRGEAARVRKMVQTLRQEGVAVFMVIGALTAQLRRAYGLSMGRNERISRNRLPAVNAAVSRLSTAGIDAILRECARLDQQAKGMLRGDAWDSFERILLAVAGATESTLETEAAYLI